jgi:hypothetical protein
MRIVWLPPEALKAAEFLRSCQAIVLLSRHHETAVRLAAFDILEDARRRLVREHDPLAKRSAATRPQNRLPDVPLSASVYADENEQEGWQANR